jgi:hypothetical protein
MVIDSVENKGYLPRRVREDTPSTDGTHSTGLAHKLIVQIFLAGSAAIHSP